MTVKIPAAHLSATNPQSKRSLTTARPFPLNDPPMPRRTGTTASAKAAELGTIVGFLDVESSARYLPEGSTTFCNVYAYDYCTLAGVYLPRVWWTGAAIDAIRGGATLEPTYGVTVTEITANALTTWFREFGADFGWRPEPDLSQLQGAVDKGSVGIVCARHRVAGHHGHVVAVVPETPEHEAFRMGGKVVFPLQSQAGRQNRAYFANAAFWSDPVHASPGFWLHA